MEGGIPLIKECERRALKNEGGLMGVIQNARIV
jgi:hypothetical protein